MQNFFDLMEDFVDYVVVKLGLYELSASHSVFKSEDYQLTLSKLMKFYFFFVCHSYAAAEIVICSIF